MLATRLTRSTGTTEDDKLKLVATKVLKAYKALTYYAVDSFNAFYKGKKIEISGNLKALDLATPRTLSMPTSTRSDA